MYPWRVISSNRHKVQQHLPPGNWEWPSTGVSPVCWVWIENAHREALRSASSHSLLEVCDVWKTVSSENAVSGNSWKIIQGGRLKWPCLLLFHNNGPCIAFLTLSILIYFLLILWQQKCLITIKLAFHFPHNFYCYCHRRWWWLTREFPKFCWNFSELSWVCDQNILNANGLGKCYEKFILNGNLHSPATCQSIVALSLIPNHLRRTSFPPVMPQNMLWKLY